MARTATRKKAESVAPPTPAWRRAAMPVGVVAVIALAVGAFSFFDKPIPGIAFADAGHQHIATPDEAHAPYNSSPPSSGPHMGGLLPWGITDAVYRPEQFVHNLEDGGVILAYDCPSGCPEITDEFTRIWNEHGGHILMLPYSDITHQGVSYRAAAVAWTRVLYIDSMDATTKGDLASFVNIFEGVDRHQG